MQSLGKVGVVGSGAVGLYYGGKLAVAGQNVHFLMRSDLAAVRRRGIVIRQGDEEVHLPDVQAAGSPEEIGECDLVIIALKATANDALQALVRPLLGPDTALLTLENGLGSDELLAEQFGGERVMGGLCFVCLTRVDHGVVEYYGHGAISIGEFSGPVSERLRRVVAALAETGIDTTAVEDLAAERWKKLVWNVPFNGLSISAGGVTVADILADAGLEAVARGLMQEVIAGAAALGIAIPADYEEFQIERSRNMGPYKPSSLIDWQAGRPVEVEAIWGEPFRRATAAGCEAPRLEMLYHTLRKLSA